MLFEHFMQRRYAQAPKDEHHTRPLDFRIAAEWRGIVRKHLYSGVESDLGDKLDAHAYLKTYVPLIQNSHMTITYNFDDLIEQALIRSRLPEETDISRGFESVTSPWTQFRRTTANIYHPNGIVPQNLLEAPSDRFVFSEASYADQLMGIFAGDHAGLLSHFSKHTCLFIGLSLDDETLRNVLIQGARSSPGNFHYYVHYLNADEQLDEETRQAITRANFKVYNLVTLFLGNEEIRALGELINIKQCPTDQLCDFADQHSVPVRFRFYITGPLGVGKSTTINHLRNLNVIDEWLESRPSILAKNWEDLTEPEKVEVDDWIIGQFNRKNAILRNKREGIFVLDRGPLDPLSFTPDADWKTKAASIRTGLCPGQSTWRVEDGCVILLQGEGSELSLRMILTQRKVYTAEKLTMMEDRLGKAYGSNGVARYDTRGLTPADIVQRVAEIIHLEDYEPTANLHDRLGQIEREGFDVEN